MGSKISEKILGGLIAQKAPSRYGVFFTETRVLFGRIGSIPLGFTLIVISAALGLLCALYALAESGLLDSPSLITFFFMMFIPALFIFAAARIWTYFTKNKFLKFGGSPSETILAVDKKNFQIPYSDILRVEIKKGSFARMPKMIIQTTKEKYDFNLVEKHKYESQLNLVRSSLPQKTYVV